MTWEAFEAASSSRFRLKERDLSVRVATQTDDVMKSIAQVGKTYISPWLDPRLNDFGPRNFFWLIAFDADGAKIVGGGRRDEYEDDAAPRIAAMFNRGFGEGTVIAANPQCNHALSGVVAYLGDLHSVGTTSLGRNAVREFLVIANYLCTCQFNADVTYSFFSGKDVRRGSADVNGFTDRIVDPLHWGNTPDQLSSDGVLAYRPRNKNAAYFLGARQELDGNEPRWPAWSPLAPPAVQDARTDCGRGPVQLRPDGQQNGYPEQRSLA